ncbi:MAG: hypothetical protein ACKVOL_10880 [Novosphingobium sp.]
MSRSNPRPNPFAPLLMATALCLSLASPAYAQGKAERARTAIAEAQTKIDTAEALGTSTAQPGQTAEANAALAQARENLAAGHKPEAIADAIRASALADTALGMMQKHAKEHAEAMQAKMQADGAAQAQMSVDAAHQQTDMANDRAVRAENSAAASATDAAVARSAAMTAQAAQPTQVQTTVTTEQPAPAEVRKLAAAPVKHTRRRMHHRHVVHHRAAAKVTTTTTVTHNPM